MKHPIRSLMIVLFCLFVGLSGFVSGTLMRPSVVDNSHVINSLQTELQQLQTDLTAVQEEKKMLLTQQIQQDAVRNWTEVGDLSFLTKMGYLEFPLLRKSDYYELQLQFNGQNAYLLLDTGASQTVLDAERSARFDLPAVDLPFTRQYVGLGGESASVQTVIIQEVRLGSLRFKDVVVSKIDLGPINALLSRLGSFPVDGLLGDDFLQSGGAVMDFENEKIYLRADMNFSPFSW